ncbi:hypothetical protein ACIRPX_00675 [Streptomyces sp. NPDC101225]|uniref:hypothetical protein n=1 Tax=Streptomyces sp. NPDC101225 TaxID=3366135 RepID=UPI0037F33B1D
MPLSGGHATRPPGAAVVGHLEQGGAAHWFVTEMQGRTFRDGSAENHWWAGTTADHGRRCPVPEVCRGRLRRRGRRRPADARCAPVRAPGDPGGS